MRFLLVHGSWHDGRAWGGVRRALEAAGHEVHTPSLPGHGPGADTDVGFQDYVDALTGYVEETNLSNFVFAGHSFGGAVVAKASEALKDRIRRLIFCAAIVPHDGNAAVDEAPPQMAQVYRSCKDQDIALEWPIWREVFIGDTDFKTAQRAFAMLSPEPIKPILEPLDLSAFYTSEVPRSYIHLAEDYVFPPGEWALFPRMFSRLGLCRLLSVPGSHELMFSAPERLAEALVKAGRN